MTEILKRLAQSPRAIQMSKRKTWFVVGGMMAVAALGFIDATYLTVEHYRGAVLTCTITGDCQSVVTSAYSAIVGVPVALLGSIYYAAMIVLLVAYLDRRSEKVLNAATWFSIVGFVASIYFVSLQAFVLDAWCQYCLVSAATSTLLFLIGMGYHFSRKRHVVELHL